MKQLTQQDNMSDILNAFIQQTYGSLEKAKEADHLADLNPNAQPEHDENFVDTALPNDIENEFQKQLIAKHFKNIPIKDSMNIPTQLKDETLNQKTEAHPSLKNYDHSLEQHRGHKLGLIKIKDVPVGDVGDMFDNMFDDNSNLVE